MIELHRNLSILSFSGDSFFFFFYFFISITNNARELRAIQQTLVRLDLDGKWLRPLQPIIGDFHWSKIFFLEWMARIDESDRSCVLQRTRILSWIWSYKMFYFIFYSLYSISYIFCESRVNFVVEFFYFSYL